MAIELEVKETKEKTTEEVKPQPFSGYKKLFSMFLAFIGALLGVFIPDIDFEEMMVLLSPLIHTALETGIDIARIIKSPPKKNNETPF